MTSTAMRTMTRVSIGHTLVHGLMMRRKAFTTPSTATTTMTRTALPFIRSLTAPGTQTQVFTGRTMPAWHTRTKLLRLKSTGKAVASGAKAKEKASARAKASFVALSSKARAKAKAKVNPRASSDPRITRTVASTKAKAARKAALPRARALAALAVAHDGTILICVQLPLETARVKANHLDNNGSLQRLRLRLHSPRLPAVILLCHTALGLRSMHRSNPSTLGRAIVPALRHESTQLFRQCNGRHLTTSTLADALQLDMRLTAVSRGVVHSSILQVYLHRLRSLLLLRILARLRVTGRTTTTTATLTRIIQRLLRDSLMKISATVAQVRNLASDFQAAYLSWSVRHDKASQVSAARFSPTRLRLSLLMSVISTTLFEESSAKDFSWIKALQTVSLEQTRARNYRTLYSIPMAFLSW